MVAGEGTGTSKKVYNGKEYDYVFDIDIEDGKPPLKLPYNFAENAWDAARKFLETNELPLSYYEQVANWITENTKGARFGQSSGGSSQPPTQAQDPWGTERRYRPGDVDSSSRKLPQRGYLDIIEGNPANAINIISQKAEEFSKAGTTTPEHSLHPDEITALKVLPTQLQSKKDPHPTPTQTSALLKVISYWPRKSRVPGIGVLALLAVSPAFVSSTNAGDKTIVDTLGQAGLFEPRQETANNVVHAIRLLVNSFKSEQGRAILDGGWDATLKLVRPFASEPESVPQAKALSTLYINYAVLLKSSAGSEGQTRDARAKTLLTDIAVLLECDSPHASDGDVLYRTLLALGTLCSLSPEFRESLKGGISGTLHFVSAKPTSQSRDVKELIQEIRDELR